jgi:cytochrome c oxidase subunit 2
MIGEIVALPPKAFQEWLGGAGEGSLAGAGEKLFQDLGCVTCHTEGPTARGPSLVGVYGRPVKLEGGDMVQADDAYIRESILDPRAKVAAGYQPVMPTYVGQVSEEGVVALIAYIRMLGERAPAGVPPAPSQIERKEP